MINSEKTWVSGNAVDITSSKTLLLGDMISDNLIDPMKNPDGGGNTYDSNPSAVTITINGNSFTYSVKLVGSKRVI
jgi:hypothetical protein